MTSRNQLPASAIKILANADDPSLLIRVARRNDCPRETLAKLAKSLHADVRATVAAHWNTTDTVLHFLMLDTDFNVSQIAAQTVSRRDTL